MSLYLTIPRFVMLAVVTLGLAAPTFAEEKRGQDHEQLRTLLKLGAEALTTRKVEPMLPYLHPEFVVVTVDNRKLKGVTELQQYWNEVFNGKTPLLKSMVSRPEADQLTTFLDDNSGIVYGTSNDRYTFVDGDVRDMSTRWSAVVQKDGKIWKLVSIHFSTNVLNNPVVDAAKSAAKRAAIIAAAFGLAVGLVIGFLLWRRRAN